MIKGVFKGGGVQGVQTHPEIFNFFLKSEGKERERKRKKGMLGGGGLPLNIFFGVDIFFEWGWEIFGGGVRNFRGGGWEIFGGLRNFRGGWEIFGGGLRNFGGGWVIFGGGWKIFVGEGWEKNFLGGGWEISGGGVVIISGRAQFFR